MSKSKVGAVVLSRFSSNRLRGKALIEIQGKPVLLCIVERLREVLSEEKIIVATSLESSDDPIFNFCNQENIRCFRGSLENVAERFHQASLQLNVGYVARINGDNIFMDIPLMREMVKLTEEARAPFISNVKGRTYPKGMSIEIVEVDHYQKLLPAINKNADYKEHVTLYLYDHERSDYRFVYNSKNNDFAGFQLALDTEEDLARTEMIFSFFEKPHTFYNMMEIFAILKQIDS